MEIPDASLILEARGLSLSYGARIAVEGVTLELRRGEVLGFLGPNGAGKSTTMRMLTGNLRPDSGTVSLCGIDLWKDPLKAKARLGYLPETPPLYRDMKVDDYLKFAMKLHRAMQDSLPDIKEKCGLQDAGSRLIGSLSKGYQQRVGIAQAILHNPDVIILDEPTSGLDPNQIREIRALIREIGNRCGVILSTHILSEVESLCDRVEILHHGKQVYKGSLEGSRHAVEVGFKHPPSIDELSSIHGISKVEALSDGLFILRHEEKQNPTEALVALAADKGWGLTRIAPSRGSLEAVFAELTREGS